MQDKKDLPSFEKHILLQNRHQINNDSSINLLPACNDCNREHILLIIILFTGCLAIRYSLRLYDS